MLTTKILDDRTARARRRAQRPLSEAWPLRLSASAAGVPAAAGRGEGLLSCQSSSAPVNARRTKTRGMRLRGLRGVDWLDWPCGQNPVESPEGANAVLRTRR